jgi:cytochrome d ubiquinol oxidase subunit I
VQVAHTLAGSCLTAFTVTASLGAFYKLMRTHDAHAEKLLRVGVIGGMIAAISMAVPTGDLQARLVIKHQPIAFAAMEGHFHTEDSAGLALIGQPNMDTMTLDNPVVVPSALSFMTYQRFDARIEGLTSFPRDQWPDNVPLLYYSYHLMVGIGTLLIGLMSFAVFMLWRKRLLVTRPLLWALTLALPFPYIANTAGWLTAELGRQPWLIYGLMRTRDGTSTVVSSGNVLFTLLGYMGLYALLSLLFFFLFVRIVTRGPSPAAPSPKEGAV